MNIHLRVFLIVVIVLIRLIKWSFIVDWHAFSEKVSHHEVEVRVKEQFHSFYHDLKTLSPIREHRDAYEDHVRVLELIIEYMCHYIFVIIDRMDLSQVAEK